MLPMVFLGGCGDDNAEVAESGNEQVVNVGFFKDSSVSGINYSTETLSGKTSSTGAFNYLEGETVTFSIGDINFPATLAKFNLTPVDLLGSDALITNIAVTNISRLLQTLDSNNNPSDGTIEISDNAINLATGITLDFTDEDFGVSGSPSKNYIDSLGRTLEGLPIVMVSAVDARAHLSETISEIEGNTFSAAFLNGNTFSVTHESEGPAELYFKNDLTGAMKYSDGNTNPITWSVSNNSDLLLFETESLVETNWIFSESSISENIANYEYSKVGVVSEPGIGRMSLIENAILPTFLVGNIFLISHEDSSVSELNFLSDGLGTITYSEGDVRNISWGVTLGVLKISEEGEDNIEWVFTATEVAAEKVSYSYIKYKDEVTSRTDEGPYDLILN